MEFTTRLCSCEVNETVTKVNYLIVFGQGFTFMKISLVFAVPLAMAAASCSNQGADNQGAEPLVAQGDGVVAARSPSTADVNGAASGANTTMQAARTITLTGFTCGDSCYLEYTDDGAAKTALCRVSQCDDWADTQSLPPELKGKRATARFGTGNQVDAAGNIMARDYPTIENLTILGSPAPTAPTARSGAGLRVADAGAGPLGLMKGVYTSSDDCGSIANAGLRIYDGVGLNGSATKTCRIKVTSRSGQTYNIANDCAATYNGKRSTQTFAVKVSGSSRFTLSNGETGTFNFCPASRLNPTMRQYASEARSQGSGNQANSPRRQAEDGGAAIEATVPPRFRGLFAVDRKACAQDYNYNPAFQNVTVTARSVNFFETGGPVTDVNVEGDSIAITMLETVGDGRTKRAIYLAINRDGTVRYRPGTSEPSRTYARC